MFGVFLRQIGVDATLSKLFRELKAAKSVIYPMAAQLRLLLDLFVAGEHRVFGLESLAADGLFVWLAGGVVPSVDTVYRDMARFDEPALGDLEDMMVDHGLHPVRQLKHLTEIHLDFDTTVLPVFGENVGGAEIGYNPRYRGRLSLHPIVARVAQTDTCVGAKLRPGDTSFGESDVHFVELTIDKLRGAIGPDCLMHVRIDSAGDCSKYMKAVHDKGALFVTKAKMTQDLCAKIFCHSSWTTVDYDADGYPCRQVAEIEFRRGEWGKTSELPVRVVAVRTSEREHGSQLYLWEGLEMSVQVYLSNDLVSDADDIAWRYDKRAGIEPLIAEWKNGWGIGKLSSSSFEANSALLLLKLLSHNLLRRYVQQYAPELGTWRAGWIRRAIILVPGRISRSGRRRTLHTPSRPALPHALE
jgi:hypothetical protein